jgi:Flp pilus assembly protein TadD
MKRWSILLLAATLVACAAPPPAPPADELLHDAWFAPPQQPVDTASVFAVSPAMRDYLASEIAPRVTGRGRQGALVAALYERGQLRLEYDAGSTRTAAQAFEARAGNCLSLLIMTAAFARELELGVSFQRATDVDTWGRQGDLYVHSGHVNITLTPRLLDHSRGRFGATAVTIDFLPQELIAGLRTRPIEERTVLAMYMNNRAAEMLVQGRVDDAYWFVREALRHDAGFTSALNTLGVVYLRRGRAPQAEAALRRALHSEPDNPRALGNLAQALTLQGRADEATAVQQRLARVEPDPPYHWFNQGMAAAQAGDWETARGLFAREARRADFNAEFHHWLAVAYWNLGRPDAARRELELARQNGATPAERARYAAKLEWLAAPH